MRLATPWSRIYDTRKRACPFNNQRVDWPEHLGQVVVAGAVGDALVADRDPAQLPAVAGWPAGLRVGGIDGRLLEGGALLRCEGGSMLLQRVVTGAGRQVCKASAAVALLAAGLQGSRRQQSSRAAARTGRSRGCADVQRSYGCWELPTLLSTNEIGGHTEDLRPTRQLLET